MFCEKCGNKLAEDDAFCSNCGANVSVANDEWQNPIELNNKTVINGQELVANEAIDIGSLNDNGNIAFGIVGAFLFALIGGLLYFVVAQIGFIAGIIGFATFALANVGYNIFAGIKNKFSTVKLITSIIVTVAVIFIAEYFSVAYQIYDITKETYNISFFDAVRATPNMLSEAEVGSAVTEDLLFAYLFTFIAVIGDIVKTIKTKNKIKKEI